MIATALTGDLRLRWNRMQQYMQHHRADGCLLTIDVNLYYTTGRIFNGYFYLPAEGEPWFFVKRPNDITGQRIEPIRKPEQIAELFTERGIPKPEKLLLEADELTYNEFVRLQSALSPQETGNATAMMRTLRAVKTPWEIEQLRFSAQKHAESYNEIPSVFQPGMTDVEFQIGVEKIMRKNGSLGLFRAFGTNMDIFMGSILAGDNAENPSPFDFALGGGGVHASVPIGANGTLLREGVSVMVDMAGTFTPYMTDMTRVFSVGRLSDEAYRAHQVSIDIQSAVQAAAKPGTACADLYHIAHSIAEREGLAHCFMGTKQQAKFVGHGVGMQVNELPILTPRSKEILESGVVFALEPKFVIPGTGAVGIENTFLVTDSGTEKLTQCNEQIIPLDH